MKVVNLPGADGREAARLLHALARRALAGDLDGVQIQIHTIDGLEDFQVAGFYAREPHEAFRALLRRSWQLAQEIPGRAVMRSLRRRRKPQ